MLKYKVTYRVVDKSNTKRILLSQTSLTIQAPSETNAINEVKKRQAAYIKSREGELDVVSVTIV